MTIIWFGDFTCSACDDFDLNDWPAIVTNYVRTGKVQVVWRGLHIIDSHFTGQTDALRADEFGAAASEQNKLWNYGNLFYLNQETEGSNYVTPAFLAKMGSGVGLNVALATKDMTSAYVTAQVSTADNPPPSTRSTRRRRSCSARPAASSTKSSSACPNRLASSSRS